MGPPNRTLSAAIKRALTENLGLKLLSFAAALTLFSLVRGSDSAEGSSDSQLSLFVDVIHTVPPSDSDKMLVSEVPPRVRVTLQGSRFLLGSVDREDLQTDITLTDPGETYYFFDPDDFAGVPAGVRISDIDPPSVPLRWDNRVTQTVMVDVTLDGEAPEGLRVVQPVKVTPPQVRLVGAQREMPTGTVATEPIAVASLEAGRHERRVRLEPPADYVVYEGGAFVDVVIEILPELRSRTLEGLEVVPVGPGGEVRPRIVSVALSGPPTSVDAIRPETVIPIVDATDPQLVGTVPVPVEVRGLPEGVSVDGIQPDEVLLTVPRRPTPAP